ncbi:MAG: glycosyltransferase [Gammaproteobacteria bacterium]|nr:glycosyltransferase [Gammaproteobacteria bacterium]MCP5424045.1 glycosyltransferase [Gammaproteobacteria bacterium]MCP5459521.1 glycosyltransferase [Gammaproteobacteria bacterium]
MAASTTFGQAPDLLISIVTYRPDFPILRDALRSLAVAVSCAKRNACLGRVQLYLIDNGPTYRVSLDLDALLNDESAHFDCVRVVSGHGNIGYGAAHNLALTGTCSDFHLVLNPDVWIEESALTAALSFMNEHPDVGLLAPAAVDGEGVRQYLCKRYPAVLDLLLRGFAPATLQRLFRKRLHAYEMRDRIGEGVVWDVPIVSGCFMLFRYSVLRRLQGFSPAYFLYFEDFDVSLRTARIARIVYVPSVRIAHFGGNAARKGWRHIALFARSARIFFNRHGWKWI